MSIAIRNVSKDFGNFHALRDVSLDIDSGELVALTPLALNAGLVGNSWWWTNNRCIHKLPPYCCDNLPNSFNAIGSDRISIDIEQWLSDGLNY